MLKTKTICVTLTIRLMNFPSKVKMLQCDSSIDFPQFQLHSFFDYILMITLFRILLQLPFFQTHQTCLCQIWPTPSV